MYRFYNQEIEVFQENSTLRTLCSQRICLWSELNFVKKRLPKKRCQNITTPQLLKNDIDGCGEKYTEQQLTKHRNVALVI